MYQVDRSVFEVNNLFFGTTDYLELAKETRRNYLFFLHSISLAAIFIVVLIEGPWGAAIF